MSPTYPGLNIDFGWKVSFGKICANCVLVQNVLVHVLVHVQAHFVLKLC